MLPLVITRHLRHTFLLLLLSAVTASASDITIGHVFTGWREAASFKRISEYFSGQENPGDTTVLRTHPDQRAGFYFLVSTVNTGAPIKAQIVIHLIMPIGKQGRTHTFTTELPAKKTILNLGLTGADWLDPKTNPIAWKVDLTTSDGQLLASEKSYLWDKPVGK